MSYALTHSTWNNGYQIVTFIQLAIGIILLATIHAWKTNGYSSESFSKSIGIVDVIKKRVFLLF